MNSKVETEIEFQRSSPELRRPIAATPHEKILEYQEASNRNWNSLHRFLGYIHEENPESILELGCGAGELTTRLAKCGYQVTALDLSPDLLEATVRRAELDGVSDRVSIQEANIETFDPGGQRFDLVIAQLVLHHIDIQKTLEVMSHALKPNGVAVILEPVAFSPLLQKLRDITPVPKHISPNERQLNRTDLSLIAEYFEDVTIDYFYLFGRVRRLLPGGRAFKRILDGIEIADACLLRHIHPMRKLSGAVVVRCRSPLSQQAK